MIQSIHGFLQQIKTARDRLLFVGVAIDNEELLCIMLKRLAQRVCLKVDINCMKSLKYHWDKISMRSS